MGDHLPADSLSAQPCHRAESGWRLNRLSCRRPSWPLLPAGLSHSDLARLGALLTGRCVAAARRWLP